MGRRAKYLTAESRAAARSVYKAEYNKRPHSKTLRSIQNRRAYLKRKESLPPEKNLRLPHIPRVVHKHAIFPLPTTSLLFRSAYHENADPGKDEHAIWDQPPPYVISPSFDVEADIERTLEYVQGRRLRVQRNHEQSRIEGYNTLPLATFKEEILVELAAYLREFSELKNCIKTFRSSPVDFRMGQSLMTWKAKRAMDLAEDWSMLKGKNREDHKFSEGYLNRWHRFGCIE